MVTITKKYRYTKEGHIHLEDWLNYVCSVYTLKNPDLIKEALHLAEIEGAGLTTFYGQPCFEQGLEMAELLLELKLDDATIASAILYSSLLHSKDANHDIIINSEITGILHSSLHMNPFGSLQSVTNRNSNQLDRLRKTFLAMVADIRVVLIKLAERISIMRGIRDINPTQRKMIAQETLDIYAPLANRLGIGQIKWELEDNAFHYLNPEAYKRIAGFLAEKRTERETRITQLLLTLTEALKKADINASLSGRAKHIYSIFLKMQRKNLSYEQIFDYSAARILVTSITDCYSALSIVHTLWQPIPEEFDDYISKPKTNGYQSIHTAVIGPDDRTLEIQIRTHAMHNQAEHGLAAHWIYKENNVDQKGYEAKISYLRQLLAWQQDITPTSSEKMPTEDRVYVFTPKGDVYDLSAGATPLDFAYHVHTDLGHRCRGAKVNGNIVPLNYSLTTGETVELLTQKQLQPSRDWLIKEQGYLNTSRAQAKVRHWFKQLEIETYLNTGKTTVEKELAKAGFTKVNYPKLANDLNYKNETAFFISYAHGNIKLSQLIPLLTTKPLAESENSVVVSKSNSQTDSNTHKGFTIQGVKDLLLRIAKCCKPIPGDNVKGFITQGRGVSVHREDCKNLNAHLLANDPRLVTVHWDTSQQINFFVDLTIIGVRHESLIREITALLTHARVDLITLRSKINKEFNRSFIDITIEISDLNQLNQLLNAMRTIPHVIEIKRIK